MTRCWGHLLTTPQLRVYLSVQTSHRHRKMFPYDDWNKLGEDEDEELQDASVRAPLQFAL